jgi:hypothetical protein
MLAFLLASMAPKCSLPISSSAACVSKATRAGPGGDFVLFGYVRNGADCLDCLGSVEQQTYDCVRGVSTRHPRSLNRMPVRFGTDFD